MKKQIQFYVYVYALFLAFYLVSSIILLAEKGQVYTLSQESEESLDITLRGEELTALARGYI